MIDFTAARANWATHSLDRDIYGNVFCYECGTTQPTLSVCEFYVAK